MRFTVLDVPQRSPEWRAARLGRLTGSGAHAMLSTIKTGEAAARRDLRVRLVLERLTGCSQENEFQSAEMRHGIETEAAARRAYEATSGQVVTQVGFLQHPTLMTGCSPDGVIGDFEGLISIKCPKSATHLETIRSRRIPLEYLRQLTHECWISGALWADYWSFDARFPPALQAVRIHIDVAALDLVAYDIAARAFLADVDTDLTTVRTITDLSAVLTEAVA